MKLVAYYRVSTDKQKRSGLGLEGQEAAVAAFVAKTNAKVLASYTEAESGKRTDRPELLKAITHARRSRATLVVAKLDRLARNVAFLSALMESGLDFIACDNPHANRLTIQILAAVAEDEARRISERTKAALKAYKARGGKLGASRPECRNLTTEARRTGIAAAAVARSRMAREAYRDIRPELVKLRADGLSFQLLADRMNAAGHTTRRGAPWRPMQVRRVLAAG